MKYKFPQPIHHQWLGLLSVAAILVGMLLSDAAMSIGVIALIGNAVLNWNVGELFRRFLRHKALLGLTGVFLIYLLSGLWSENTDFLLRRLRLTLPFLTMPFGILAIPRFDRRDYFSLLYGFFWIVAIMCLYSLGLYLRDYEQITELYKRGQVMPTPVMHIRFSLMVAFCVAIGWYLFTERFYWRFPWERYLLLAMSAFLAVYLHVLAVRSGLLGLYGLLLFFLLHAIVKYRKYAIGLAAAAVLAVGVFLAFRYVPTLKNKIGYTRYSVNLFLKRENLEELSDSYRLGSLLAGLELGRQHPWTGVGIGDVRDECDVYFRQHLPALAGQGLMPHNQYLFILAVAGLPGMLYFIWISLYPLYYRRSYRNMLAAAFHIIAISSFMVEHTLETHLGLTFYLLFVLLGIRFQDEMAENEKT